MHWIPVGASLFASNIGSLHFVGLAGSGAASGIAVGNYELNAMYVVLMLGYLFLPVYIASGVYTMPEYLKRRFGGRRIQMYLAVLALLVYIFTKISADLYAGAIFIEQSLNWDIYFAILLLLAVAALFTITGGLTAVIWTDFVQTIIMIVGAFALMALSYIKVGGFSAMVEKYPSAIPNTTLNSNTSCGYPRKDYMHLIRSASSGDIPWPGIIGLTINSIWYWCSDQVIVQRALAGKTYDHAKAGTIFCGYLKILPLFLIIFPGMIARILFPDTVGCADPDVCYELCGSRAGCANLAYPTLVLNLMPPGARGLMLAVMLAALMSSLTSIFNSSSTIFAMDMWTLVRKKASELEIMIVGRIFVVVLVAISIVWIPVIKASQGSDLFVYIQVVSSFLQPPICAVFLLAIFWQRLNEKGAFWSLMTGLVVGMVRFIVEYSYTVPNCGDDAPDPRPGIVTNFHYLYFSIFLFLLTGSVAIVVSLLTKPIDPRCLQRLTYLTRHSTEKRIDVDIFQSDTASSSEEDSAEAEIKAQKKLSEINMLEIEVIPRETEKVAPSSKTAEKTDLLNGERGDGDVEANAVGKISEEGKEADITPCWRKMFNWICGIENLTKSGAKKTVTRYEMRSIKQNPIGKNVTNALAVLLMAIGMFFYGYFA
ncbi:sodium/glucose cotransporter 1-like [Liolophura sinensis]|uniref:sodium/glucose cotransporter 1-like n=1 Tax=Liolophura sinensis TaxID=3198878 RepID=UPI0031590FCC